MKYRNFSYTVFLFLVLLVLLFIYYQFSVYNTGVSLKYEEWAKEELTATKDSYLTKIKYVKSIILGVIIVFIVASIFRKKLFRRT